MPKPHYIICASSFSLDQATNLLSLFHVVEGITQTSRPAGSPPPHPPFGPTIVGIAAWMRELDDDAETVFEYEHAVHLPGEASEKRIGAGEFAFTARIHRFLAGLVIEHWRETGDFVFINRIRKKDSPGVWQSQQFVVPITVIDAEVAPAVNGQTPH